MKIILIRHAETEKNQEGIVQGHEDSSLTKKGQKQAKKIRDFLKNKKIAAAYCSSLGRSIETANYILEAHNIKVIPSDELKEVNWGEFSEFPTSNLVKKWSKYYEEQKAKGILRENIRPKGGENAFDHAKRIKRILDKLISKHKKDVIVIVGHSGTNKVIIGLLNKKDPEDFYKIKQDNACINILELDENGNLVKQEINLTNHLK